MITNMRLAAPLLRLEMDEPLGKVEVARAGKPETDKLTLSGMFPVGVTVTVKLAGVPAVMGGGALGDAATVKSFTVAVALSLRDGGIDALEVI